MADDKATHDRLHAAATEFVEKFARTFGPAPPPIDGWVLVEGQAEAYVFKAAGPIEGKLRPYTCTLAWASGFEVGMTLKFACVPGLSSGLVFRLPSDASTAGKPMSIAVKVDAAAVKTASFTVRSLLMKTGGGAAGNDAAGGGGDAAGNNEGGGSSDNPPPPPADAPNVLVRWKYDGERADLHGEMVAPIGARVRDDVYGDAILRGERPGELLLLIDGEEKSRTSGHVYFDPAAPQAPTEVVSQPEMVDGGEDAELPPPPPPPPPTEAEILAVFAQNEVAWTDEEETVLQGTANTDVDVVWKFLDRMGVDSAVLYVPDRTYTLERSIYGAKVLVMTTEMPGGDEGGNGNDDHGDDGDDAAVNPDETQPPDDEHGHDETQESPVLEVGIMPETEVEEAMEEVVMMEEDAVNAVVEPIADAAEEQPAEAAVVAAPKRRKKSPEEVAAAKEAKGAEAVARKAAREAEVEARKRAREEAAAAAREARDAARAQKAAAKSVATPKHRAPSSKAVGKKVARPKTALAGALRTLLSHLDGSDDEDVAPALAAKLLTRAKGLKMKPKASTSRVMRAPPPPPPPAPPPPPLPSRSGRVPKRKDRLEIDIADPASSFRSAPPSRKASVDPSHEMGVPAYALPGEQVVAMGLRGGVRLRFRAEVTALRKTFPRIVVKYVSTEEGETNPVALPEIRTAYLMMADVFPKDW